MGRLINTSMRFWRRALRNAVGWSVIYVVLLVGFSILSLMLGKTSTWTSDWPEKLLYIAILLILAGAFIGIGGTPPSKKNVSLSLIIVVLAIGTGALVLNFATANLTKSSPFMKDSSFFFFFFYLAPALIFSLAGQFVEYNFEPYLVERALNSDLLNAPEVRQFFNRTMTAWASDALSDLDTLHKESARRSYNAFVSNYLPVEGTAMLYFLKDIGPRVNEFLVVSRGLTVKEREWFVLTNCRLIQRSGKYTPIYHEIELADVLSIVLPDPPQAIIKIVAMSGTTREITDAYYYPKAAYLTKAIVLAKSQP